MIEVLEHLHKNDLPLFENNIFGIVQPKAIIITTPNIDYNKNYRNDPEKFRHHDHKFEFSQKEFQEWCKNVCSKFNYDQKIEGIGKYHGDEHPERGFCSQICTFTKIENSLPNLNKCQISLPEPQKVKLIDTIEYPV